MGAAPPPRPSRRRRPPGRLDRLGKRIDTVLKSLDPWTGRFDRAAKFVAAVAALVIAFGAFGITQCGQGPTPSNVPAGSDGQAKVSSSPASSDATSGPTGSGTSSPGPSASPPPTQQAPTEYRLRWVDSQNGTSIDGSLLSAGTDVWLQERFPSDPPSGFDVLPVLDPALEPSLGDVEAVADFDAVRSGFVAHSDTEWRLPLPPPSSGFISYRFRDNAGRESRELRVGTVAALAIELDAPSSGQPLQETLSIESDLEIGVDVAFLADADVGVQLLTPWDEGELSLTEFIRAYYTDVTLEPADAEAATQRFIEANSGALPDSQPEGWGFSMEPGAFSGEAGENTQFAMTGTVGSVGSALLAIRLVDQADPSRVAVSRIFRIEAVGPDVAPEVIVVEPASFATGSTYNLDSDGTALFTELQLTARVEDADGPIPDESIVWTTDRGDLQPNADPVLGTGEFLITTLYAEGCPGTDHVVTLTVDDGDGHVVTQSGTLSLICPD